jgi:hypothetical protein
MRRSAGLMAFLFLAACGSSSGAVAPTAADEFGFRQLRHDYHVACTMGDPGLLRTVWTDDAVLTTPDGTVEGGDEITSHIAVSPGFGTLVTLTPEATWWVIVYGDHLEFGFESVGIDIGANDLHTVVLASAGVQNPDVEIVAHTHSIGRAIQGADGRWRFEELVTGDGPLPAAPRDLDALPTPGSTGDLDLATGDELAYQRMRQDFHLANTLGDADLMRTVWAEDAVFRGGGNEIFGAGAITDFFAGDPAFGMRVNLTPEHSARTTINGGFLDYAFECIALAMGGLDYRTTPLAVGGAQNPSVQIVWHSHSQGRAVRVGEGRWAFLEFNGAQGPLPPAP